MVTSISRNWVGGLSSGMDTQSLIDKLMQAERVPVDRLEQKRNTLSMQKTMLQDINLKLFELQNKATDLTFSKTFNTKKVTASDSGVLSATAGTSAKVGTYTLKVKQVATSTKVTSQAKLAGPLELGFNLQGSKTTGGGNTRLDSLGVTPGNLTVAVAGGGTHVLGLGSVNGSSTVNDLVAAVNSAIDAVGELSGKVKATFDDKTNRMEFNLLDSTKDIQVTDIGPGDILNKMFEADGSIRVWSDTPVKDSELVTIRSGAATTLKDLGITTTSTMTITRGLDSVTLDLAALQPPASDSTTVEDMIQGLNHQIDLDANFVRGGVVTGDPTDRLVEFRYDEASRKIQLVNTDSSDPTNFTFKDEVGGDFNLRVFGNAGPVGGSSDLGKKLISETFSTGVSSGTLTIDGVQISIDNQADSLQSVLARITSSTGVRATYDSATDRISLTRKDGSNAAIGLGSASDTSNFLSVAGLIYGDQQSSALARSSSGLTLTPADAAITAFSGLGGTLVPPVAGGPHTLRVTVNGTASDVTYSDTDTLNSVLDRIKKIDGIEDAFYEFDPGSGTGRVSIRTSEKGTDATLRIEDVGAGNLAQSLALPSETLTGSALGSTLVGGRALSGIKSASVLEDAGFATTVTAGSFTINGSTFTIANPAAITLDSLMTTINNNVNAGVQAEYDQATGQFILSSKATGNTTISLGDPTDTSNFLSVFGLTGAEQAVGQNAIFNVSGMFGGADQVRQSNELSDIVSGVTFTLKDVTDSGGETITIGAETETARKAIDDFLTSYNEVTQLLYNKLTEKHDYTMDALTESEKNALTDEEVAAYEETFQIGLLSGDSILGSARSRMRVAMAGLVPGVDKLYDTLSDLGISTGTVGSSYQDTQVGLLKVTDEDKLTAALRDNPDKVSELFARDGVSESSMGIARRLKTMLNAFTKSDGLLTRRVGRSGVSSSNSEMDKQIKLINDQISRQETRMKDKENAYIKQFSDLETAMSRYQSQSQAFSQQLAQLTGS